MEKRPLILITNDDGYKSPGIKYITLLDSEIRNAVKSRGEDEDQFVYSIDASLQF
jgi:hypothetical protein